MLVASGSGESSLAVQQDGDQPRERDDGVSGGGGDVSGSSSICDIEMPKTSGL